MPRLPHVRLGSITKLGVRGDNSLHVAGHINLGYYRNVPLCGECDRLL